MFNKLTHHIDAYLNMVTMYRVTLYVLSSWLFIAFVFSFLGIFSFQPIELLESVLLITCVSWVTNRVFSKFFHVQTNIESTYISSLLLASIISPSAQIGFILWASIFTSASKYVIAPKTKHMLNPVAFGVWIAGLGLGEYASWWISNGAMFPFLCIGGALILRKLRRFEMAFAFLSAAITTTFAFTVFSGRNPFMTLIELFLYTPILFLLSTMLTEPLTTPPSKLQQVIYGCIVGVLSTPHLSAIGISMAPEAALLIGNIYSYVVGTKINATIELKTTIQLAPNIFDFVFTKPKGIDFIPGQYAEWTLPHAKSDSRGTRRFFTFTSSPTEDTIRIGVRIDTKRSSLKTALLQLHAGDRITISHIGGDFVVSEDNKPVVCIAGGIGVTPFRSIIQYYLDTHKTKNITLLYSASSPEQLVYRDVFDRAANEIGLKTYYTVTSDISNDVWSGNKGRITKDCIGREVSNVRDAVFYISGPMAMVEQTESDLLSLGVPRGQIKKDYFSGFA